MRRRGIGLGPRRSWRLSRNAADMRKPTSPVHRRAAIDDREQFQEIDLEQGEPVADEEHDDEGGAASAWRDAGENAVPLGNGSFAGEAPAASTTQPLRRSGRGKAALIGLTAVAALIFLSTKVGDGDEPREQSAVSTDPAISVPSGGMDAIVGLPKHARNGSRERRGHGEDARRQRAQASERPPDTNGGPATAGVTAPIGDAAPPTAPPPSSRESFGFEQ